MKESDKEVYGVLKMNVNLSTECVSYLNALQFWKAVEEKYQDRKRQWMEANARMVAAKLTAIRAKKKLEEARRASGAVHLIDADNCEIVQSDDDYEDAREDEFSDVESDMFADPADRYYSSLDAEKWDKIRTDLMNIHQCAGMVRRSKIIRRILVATLIVFWIFVGVMLYLYKTGTQTGTQTGTPVAVPEVLQEPTTACRLHCDQNNVIDDFIKMVFPPISVDDEI